MNFSNTLLALLVALISVSTVLVPILNNFLKKDASDVSLTYHGVHENLLNFVASNAGSKEGVVVEEVLYLFGSDTEPATFKLEPRFDQIIIVGGTVRQFTARLNFLDFPRFLAWLGNNSLARATVTVRADNYNIEDWQNDFEITNAEIDTIRRYAQGYQERFGAAPQK